MKVFIVFAHPDPQSFNAALKERAVDTFTSLGHEVRVSDLYATGFSAVSDPAEFAGFRDPDEGFALDVLQQRQADAGQVTPGIQAELDSVGWCDLLILQFPVWWFSAPAILKGWFERVLVKGAAYGGGRKHGRGVFTGRKGLISCTTGTPADTYAPDGIEGDIERLLWPVNNGIFHYLGMDPYRPFVTFAPRSMSEDERHAELSRYAKYLEQLGPGDELPMHPATDYDADHRLRPDVTPHSGFQYRD